MHGSMNIKLISTCTHTRETFNENFNDTKKYTIGQTAHKELRLLIYNEGAVILKFGIRQGREISFTPRPAYPRRKNAGTL